jgi:hypothetical protein
VLNCTLTGDRRFASFVAREHRDSLQTKRSRELLQSANRTTRHSAVLSAVRDCYAHRQNGWPLGSRKTMKLGLWSPLAARRAPMDSA